jgi:hypothetical protein
MRPFLPLTFAAAGLLAAGIAAADPAHSTAADAGGGSPAPSARQQRLLDRIDANHDGLVSRAEYQAWIDERFAKFDANGDGRVDAEEIERAPETARRVQQRAERFVRRFDRSGTGSVSRADFETARMQRFDRLGGGADAVPAGRLLARGHGRHRAAASGDDD